MNLEDVIDPKYGLQQDEWSLSRPRFGNEGQLEVVGWSGKYQRNKKYIVKCSVCSNDLDLFGEGYFNCTKRDLARGVVPCGCSKLTKWTREQYEVLCKRKSKELHYEFLGFCDNWRGNCTKLLLSCGKHGNWNTGSIATLLKGVGCPECKNELTGKRRLKSDEEMIKSFLSSGGFYKETKFWRSDRVDTQGNKTYWFMECSVCGCTGEAHSGNLQRGDRVCCCSKHRQKEAYIGLIFDEKFPIGIKFGIANNSMSRVKKQNRSSRFDITIHSIFIFQDRGSCLNAENECKKSLECGVIAKSDMPDGYTETTWVYNLDKVIEIYERNGGIRIENID